MATLAQWVAGARPRTLPAALSPVLVGVGATVADVGRWSPVRAVLALVVAVALQVGVNYANDYADGIRGTDRERVGPVRLVGQGLARPRQVKAAALASFAVACLAGLGLAALSASWWLVAAGAACVLAAWGYTGGRSPYGYRGLGEVFVFVFFGLVATLGTQYTQYARALGSPHVTAAGFLGAIGVGALACAILVANNLRDIPTDTLAGKHTLAVRLGDRGTRRLYVALVTAAALAVLGCAVVEGPRSALGLVAFALAARPLRALTTGATGRDLVPVLAGTGVLQLGYALLLTLGLTLTGPSA
ncbi:MAG TPA: 1,4-dihydroxy-2-naphthoate polyprenyltransferase [Candidatus Lustribacter sp.]|nr:1,4-dihydroxy-2-naphthoate polyprenyltransferase [Candidatus Lustribacter sp.]